MKILTAVIFFLILSVPALAGKLPSYQGHIRGYQALTAGGTNTIRAGAKCYVEQGVQAIPFRWEYAQSGPGLALIDSSVLSYDNTKRPMPGSAQPGIWRFKAVKKQSTTVLTFYLRSITDPNLIGRTNVYTVIVK